MTAERNIHATAIAVADIGFLLTGPSGSGKSAAAVALVAEAKREGHFAALIADDQVFVSTVNGKLVARSAASIEGLLEIRGSGIISMPTLSRSILHFAVELVKPGQGERLPDKNAAYAIGDLGILPLLHLSFPVSAPWFSLSKIVEARRQYTAGKA